MSTEVKRVDRSPEPKAMWEGVSGVLNHVSPRKAVVLSCPRQRWPLTPSADVVLVPWTCPRTGEGGGAACNGSAGDVL